MAKILVLDDELFYREIVRDALEKEGHTVIAAANAREALDAISKDPVDVALVDIVLPGSMDGLAVLFKIKSQYPDVPVIMLSAHEDKQMILSALRRGATDYLTKPISPQELKHFIDQALERHELIKERENKLAKLAQLEAGTGQLALTFGGKIEITDMANAYQILETTVELVSQVLSCDRVSIMLLDKVQNKLKVVVSKGFAKGQLEGEIKEPGKTPYGWVVDNKQALLVKDIKTDDRFKAWQHSYIYQTKSFVIAPLTVGGEVIGTINCNDKKDATAFVPDDMVLLKTFSHQVSLTLQYLQAINELEAEKKQLAVLAELEKILLENREPNTMLPLILKKCQEMMEVSTASIFLKDEMTGELSHQAGWDGGKELKLKHRIKFGEGLSGRVAAEKKTFVINRPKEHKDFSQEIEWPKGPTIKNYMASPVKVGDQAIGVIRLLNNEKRSYKKQDGMLLEEIARMVGIALRNLELYRRTERSVEEAVQANQMLRRANEELELKNKELALLKRKH